MSILVPQVHNGFLRAGVQKSLAVALEGGRQGSRDNASKVGECLERHEEHTSLEIVVWAALLCAHYPMLCALFTGWSIRLYTMFC